MPRAGSNAPSGERAKSCERTRRRRRASTVLGAAFIPQCTQAVAEPSQQWGQPFVSKTSFFASALAIFSDEFSATAAGSFAPP
jgi:hypothetical protein